MKITYEQLTDDRDVHLRAMVMASDCLATLKQRHASNPGPSSDTIEASGFGNGLTAAIKTGAFFDVFLHYLNGYGLEADGLEWRKLKNKRANYYLKVSVKWNKPINELKAN